jgi:hypothetical protein
MNSLHEKTRFYEFCFPKVDTLLRVEELDGAVTVRATRDSFSDQRKISFIRELVAEGFIPEDYRWLGLPEGRSPQRGVRWLVDASWLRLDEASLARTRRIFMKSLVTAVLLAGTVIGSMLTGNPSAPVVTPPAGVQGSHWQR